MTNIKFYISVKNCNSAIESMNALKALQDEIEALMSKRTKDYLEGSTLPLVITMIANPDEADKQQAQKCNDKLWCIVSPEIETDPNLYFFFSSLGKLNVPTLFTGLLLALGIQEYAPRRSTENLPAGEKAAEDDDRPTFKLEKPKWGFDEVLLTDDTRFRILRALAIIENKELIFSTWGYGKTDKSTKSIICFYGAPGTGKTMTAHAIASQLKKPLVHSSYAEIESKWVGEGAKNLHAIFQFAEENDAVLFFDEADSFLSNRITETQGSSDKHYNRMSNELFQLLEDFNGCVVFSTNLLTDVDDAFKSRIIDSIRFELPDAEARGKLIMQMLPENFPLTHPLSEEQIKEIAELADGFSGRDIRKSMLISLAGASIRQKEEGVTVFDFSDVIAGFQEVCDYKKKMDAAAGIIPTEEVEGLLTRQKKKENLVDLAIYGMHSDGVLHEKEVTLIKDYARTLLGADLEAPIDLPTKPLQEICKEAQEGGYAAEALDAALRVVAIDGELAEGELHFINEIIPTLGFESSRKEIIDYAGHLTGLNKEWNKLNINNHTV